MTLKIPIRPSAQEPAQQTTEDPMDKIIASRPYIRIGRAFMIVVMDSRNLGVYQCSSAGKFKLLGYYPTVTTALVKIVNASTTRLIAKDDRVSLQEMVERHRKLETWLRTHVPSLQWSTPPSTSSRN